MNGYKRVACLYRVSTKSQLTDNDIPLQKKACIDFIKRQLYWSLEMEYTEKGISAYNKSEKQRDVLIQMKKDAAEGKFDVLLVFMLDRIGRREDETPFIVEWFVKQGLEVWSVNEGQQRFDEYTDKLINYIRYWQFEGESLSTSMRVAEKHKQLVKAGKYRGGPPPYGYELKRSGELNKKGYEKKKLAINETEAIIVRKIYELSLDLDTGSYKIAGYLNKNGFKTGKGKKWTVSYVVSILKNPIYKGDYVSGKVRNKRGKKIAGVKKNWTHSQETVKELVIVEESVWEKANENILLRAAKTKATNTYKKDLLLLGIIYCGDCGARLYSRTRITKRMLKTTDKQTIYQSHYYYCSKKIRAESCSGQFSYGAKKIEQAVLDEVYTYFDAIKKHDIDKAVKKRKELLMDENLKTLKSIAENILSLQEEVRYLEDEIIKCLSGESLSGSKLLSNLIQQKNNEISELINKKADLLNLQNNYLKHSEDIVDFRKVSLKSAYEFDKADIFTQKEVLNKIIESIHVYRDRIDIKFVYDLYSLEAVHGSKTVWYGGMAPACAIGSSCVGPGGPGGYGQFGFGNQGFNGGFFGGNPFGSIAVIPTCAIACFTHNAI